MKDQYCIIVFIMWKNTYRNSKVSENREEPREYYYIFVIMTVILNKYNFIFFSSADICKKTLYWV